VANPPGCNIGSSHVWLLTWQFVIQSLAGASSMNFTNRNEPYQLRDETYVAFQARMHRLKERGFSYTSIHDDSNDSDSFISTALSTDVGMSILDDDSSSSSSDFSGGGGDFGGGGSDGSW
jgi:uncharacterized membrane protein YgcG